jgi:hypothetical protein
LAQQPRGTEAGKRRLTVGARRDHELGALGEAVHERLDRVQAVLVVEDVEVVEDEHDRLR